MTEVVLYEKHEEYAEICINRPEKRNAVSSEITKQLNAYLQKAEREKIKFLLLTAKGDFFCAGGDLNELHGALTREEAYEKLSPMKEVLHKIACFPVPVICLLNGNALGGGCEIATACDIRIAREGSEFGFIQARLGILPGWGGGALLYKKIHPGIAFQWLMEADLYPTEKLLEIGWLNGVVNKEDWGDRKKILKEYTLRSYRQMVLLKRQYSSNLSAEELSGEMDEEVGNSADLWNSPEHMETVGSFLAGK